MIGRRNMGVRLFNVSSMLSNYLASPDGKSAIVHLVNYSDYPVENVTMHYLGEFQARHADHSRRGRQAAGNLQDRRRMGCGRGPRGVCATVRLEQ